MKLSLLTALLPLAYLAAAAPGNPEAAAARRIDQLQRNYQKYIKGAIKHRKTGCTSKKILERKEWGSLTKRQRKSYIDAVHCLTHKPAQTPLSEIPGVRNRYDDFVGSHLQQTPFVHADGLFLPYHRYYVFLYEKALRDECGYDGAQPYWDWTLSYQDVRQASVFDGSPYSMGSNGEYVPDREPTPLQIPGGPLITFPPATGGGCVYSGPFTPDKFSMHLGPITLGTQGPEGGLGYNPRCLARDLSPVLSQNSRPSNVTALLDGCPDLGCFNSQLDGPTGVHTSGHFQVGSIQFDVFVSPSDPIFWLHHAQMDRIWTIWQNQDPQARTFQVWGTQTSGNLPPSDNVTLDTPVNFGAISGPKKIRDLVSTIDGEFCYLYD